MKKDEFMNNKFQSIFRLFVRQSECETKAGEEVTLNKRKIKSRRAADKGIRRISGTGWSAAQVFTSRLCLFYNWLNREYFSLQLSSQGTKASCFGCHEAREICSGDTNRVCHFFLVDKFIFCHSQRSPAFPHLQLLCSWYMAVINLPHKAFSRSDGEDEKEFFYFF